MLMRPDFGIFLEERKQIRQFLIDKIILFLSLVILAFIVIDSFINLLPNGKGTVRCFIKNDSVTSGQQSYIDEYCTNQVPASNYRVPVVIFSQGLFSVLLHYSWYSMVLHRKNVIYKCKRSPDKEGEKKWLLFGYFVRTLFQFLVSSIFMIIALFYEYTDRFQINLNDSFPCTIDVDYWSPLGHNDTVQCIYISIAVNDVFIVFYSVMSGVVAIAALIGICNIFLRSGLEEEEPQDTSCWCRCPSDLSICNYCLDVDTPQNEKRKTERSKLVNQEP